MPQIVSDFYMSLFLESIKENGYLIFGVRGTFPHYNPEMFYGGLRENQNFIKQELIEAKFEEDKKSGKYKLNIGSGEQEAIDKACEESLKIFQENEKKQQIEKTKKEDFKEQVLEQIKMFQGKSVKLESKPIKKCVFNRL